MKDMYLLESDESRLERLEKERKENEEREKERKKRRIEQGRGDFEANLEKVEKNPKDAEALYQLGNYYDGGWGVSENKSKAAEFMTKAAERHYKEAQYWLGVYWLGWRTRYDFVTKKYEYIANGRDIVKGIDYLTLAANKNHAEAQNVLGLQYLNGETVRQDLYKAKELFGLACDNGNKEGCKNYQNEKLQNLPEINPFAKIFGEYWQAILGGLGALGLALIAFLFGKRSRKGTKSPEME